MSSYASAWALGFDAALEWLADEASVDLDADDSGYSLREQATDHRDLVTAFMADVTHKEGGDE